MSRAAVLWCRVSSEGQEERGHSIASQLRLGREYCERHDLTVSDEHEIVEVASAKARGREVFRRVCSLVTRPRGPRVVVVWDLDRAVRHLQDYSHLEDLLARDVEIHLTASDLVLNSGADPGVLLAAGMKALMGVHEVRQLSRRVRGAQEQARLAGGWCHAAPLGYVNVRRAGRAMLELDAERAPLICQLATEYLAGGHSMKSLAVRAEELGLRSRRGRQLRPQALHHLLRHPVLAGYVPDGPWRGRRHPERTDRPLRLLEGLHEPVIPRRLWWQVQEELDRRSPLRGGRRRLTRVRHDWAGVLSCAECGSSVVGHAVRPRPGARYVYYRCGSGKGGRGCSSKSLVPEAEVDRQLREAFRCLEVSPDLLAELHATASRRAAEDVERRRAETHALRQQEARLRARLEQAYADRADGQLDAETWSRLSQRWQGELERVRALQESQEQPETASPEDVLEALATLHDRWDDAEQAWKRRVVNTCVVNALLDGNSVRVEWREPLDSIATWAAEARRPEAARAEVTRSWLRRRGVVANTAAAQLA